jgi:hypothetical protein
MNGEPTITLEVVPQDVHNGYLIFNWVSVSVGPEVNVQGRKRTVWTKFEPPTNQPIRIAVARHGGAGPVPDNCLQSFEAMEIAEKLLSELEVTLLPKPEPQTTW